MILPILIKKGILHKKKINVNIYKIEKYKNIIYTFLEFIYITYNEFFVDLLYDNLYQKAGI